MRAASFGLFQRFGVELEYMIVDAGTLAIRPEADRLIRAVGGAVDAEVRRGKLEWSNELALHVIELKTGRPAARLGGLGRLFQEEVGFINRRLARWGACLLPGAMHPWMNPKRESRLWPHGNSDIYRAFDRIFDCSGHGWTNLQSTHLNLPFGSAAEFRRLHAAVRVLLPLMPALAASSPFVEGRLAPMLDCRLDTYRNNCRRIPSVTGRIVPERARSPSQYRREILGRIYRDLKPHDPDEVLRHEWTNARGAIARFERNTIEIRVLDVQECPRADLAIVQLIVAVLRLLTGESLSSWTLQQAPETAALQTVLRRTAAHGGDATIRLRPLLRALGCSARSMTGVEVWRHLMEAAGSKRAEWREPIEVIQSEGCLGARLVRAAGRHPGRSRLRTVYRRLADCLDQGGQFHA